MHWYTTPSISIVSILLFLLVVCPYSSLARIPNRNSYASSTQLDSRYFHASAHTAYSSHQLRPRVLDLTLVHFNHIETIVPIVNAAQILAHFYSQIYLGAEGPWAANSQRIWVRMTLGSLQLLMSASEGHTVPWGFVRWWALAMLQVVDKGYTGTYDAYFVTPEGDAKVIVSLTLRTIGALTSVAGVGIAGNGDADGGGIASGGQTLNPNARPFHPP
jgi:hypothetical protein